MKTNINIINDIATISEFIEIFVNYNDTYKACMILKEKCNDINFYKNFIKIVNLHQFSNEFSEKLSNKLVYYSIYTKNYYDFYKNFKNCINIEFYFKKLIDELRFERDYKKRLKLIRVLIKLLQMHIFKKEHILYFLNYLNKTKTITNLLLNFCNKTKHLETKSIILNFLKNA